MVVGLLFGLLAGLILTFIFATCVEPVGIAVFPAIHFISLLATVGALVGHFV